MTGMTKVRHQLLFGAARVRQSHGLQLLTAAGGIVAEIKGQRQPILTESQEMLGQQTGARLLARALITLE